MAQVGTLVAFVLDLGASTKKLAMATFVLEPAEGGQRNRCKNQIPLQKQVLDLLMSSSAHRALLGTHELFYFTKQPNALLGGEESLWSFHADFKVEVNGGEAVLLKKTKGSRWTKMNSILSAFLWLPFFYAKVLEIC